MNEPYRLKKISGHLKIKMNNNYEQMLFKKLCETLYEFYSIAKECVQTVL